MKKITSILRSLAFATLAFSAIAAKADSPRKYLLEASTSVFSTAQSQFQNWDFYTYNNDTTFIPIKYHTNMKEGQDDPFYKFNLEMNNTRLKYYGFQVPEFVINGLNKKVVGNDNADTLNKIKSMPLEMSPITLKVSEVRSGSNSKVTISYNSTKDFAGAALRVVAMQWGLGYKDSTGKTSSQMWVPIKMLPSENGSAITVGANQNQNFDFDYSLPGGLLPDQLYFVAYVQKDDTKEVLQAATNMIDRMIKTTVEASETDMFIKIARNTSLTRKIKVTNPNKFNANYRVYIVKNNSLIPTNFKPVISDTSFALAPKATKEVTITLPTDNQAFFSHLNINVAPVSKEMILVDKDLQYDVVTEDAKYAAFAFQPVGLIPSASPYFAYQELMNNSAYKNDAIYVAGVSPAVINKFDFTKLKLSVFGTNFYDDYYLMDAASATMLVEKFNNAFDAGNSVLLMSESAMSTGMKMQSFLVNFLIDKLNITDATNTIRVTKSGIATFTINGVQSDIVGKVLKSTKANEFNETQFPYLNITNDTYTISTGSDIFTKPVFYFDNNEKMVSAVRSEVANGRCLLMGFGLDAIKSNSVRANIATSAFSWLLSDESEEPKIIASSSELNFGQQLATTSVQKELKITNKGSQVLEVSKIELEDYDGVFKLDNPLNGTKKISKGESFSIYITFTPKAMVQEEIDYGATLSITSNSYKNSLLSIDVAGTGVKEITFPEIKVANSTLDFGELKTEEYKEKSMFIANKGQKDLNIKSIFCSNPIDEIYIVEGGDGEHTISANDSLEIIVGFKAKNAGSYEVTYNVQSDDPKNPTLPITFKGKAVTDGGGSVNDPAYSSSKDVIMSVTPNPANFNSNVVLEVLKGVKNVKLSIVDERGSVVSELYNNADVNGRIEIPLGAAKLSSGYYTVIANVNGEMLSVPFVVSK
jgi:hypothetical protein